jgi:hypothetical protein
MSNGVMNNRLKLANLIYSMDSFTEKDLIDKYRENIVSPYLGELQSIKEYLWDLRQFGTLRYEEGVYSVAGFGENRYA